MAQRKIIFFIIIGIIGILLAFGIMALNKETKPTTVKGNLTIWLKEWTTEDFQKIIDGFKTYAPEYKNTVINVEKKVEDTEKYRNLLLTTMSDNAGPDIFMIPQWEDAILSLQAEPIPGNVINITDFENRFDSVFGDLITQSGSNQFLMGVPLWYETLWVFYNRSLMRTGVPQNWNQVEMMYSDFPLGKYPTNFWLGKQFVPNIADIIPFFLSDKKIRDFTTLSTWWDAAVGEYFTYGDLKTGQNTPLTEWDTGNNDNNSDPYAASTLRENELTLRENTATTLDMFLRGDIGFIIWYPSLIGELEKSEKRVNSWSADLIYTEKIPQFSNKTSENIAKYNYFAISKKTTNPDIALKFLEYLMTPDAGSISLNTYRSLIPAQIAYIPSIQGVTPSKVLTKIKMDGFIPTPGMNITVFNYGMKQKFSTLLQDYFNPQNTGTENIGEKIQKSILCDIAPYIWTDPQLPCNES